MSATNLGNQYLTFDYKHPSKAEDFNTLLRGGIKPGVYSGGELTKIDETTVEISPFEAYLDVGTDQTLRVKTRDAFELSVSPTSNLIYMTYSWVEAIENWLDFNTRAPADPSVTNEVILGEAVYSGSTITGISYENKTWGDRVDLLTNYNEKSGKLDDSDEVFLLNELKKIQLSTMSNYIKSQTLDKYVNLEWETTGGATITATADELQIGYIRETSFSASVDMAVGGFGGLDTGLETNSTKYYLWAVAGEGQTSGLIASVSATAPTMPAGYTEKIRLKSIYNDASGNFLTTLVVNDKKQVIIPNGTYTAFDISDTDSILCATGSGNVILTNFTGGSISKVLHVAKVSSGNSVTLKHNDSTSGGIPIINQSGADASLGIASYGVITLLRRDTNWFSNI